MFQKKKFKKFIVSFAILLFLTLITFSFVSAQLIPEIKYPKIGTKEITATTTLGEYINYIFSFAIIVGVLITVGVLIYTGFLYLSSTGNPEQLGEAKSRIYAAFWGLIILLSSYLILNTVNPQLTIIRTTLESIERGVVLTDPTKTGPDREKVTEISIPNIQKLFGKTYLPTKIEIYGESRGQLKVKAFEKPNYKGDKTDWITSKLDNTGWTIKSLLVKGIGPGIYLHGPQEKELHLVTDLPNFHKVDDFDNKAETIEIKNLIVGTEKRTDFAAILHEDPYFKGQLRIFVPTIIESKELLQGTVSIQRVKNQVFGRDTTFDSSLVGKFVMFDVAPIRDKIYKVASVESSTELLLTTPIPPEISFTGVKMYLAKGTSGNIPPEYPVLNVRDKDEYGKVDGVSSAHVFQIGENENCQGIKLYAAPNFIVTENLPFCKITTEKTTMGVLDKDGNEVVSKETNFKLPILKPVDIKDVCGDKFWDDSVRSIEIDGKCLVVFFEHSASSDKFPGKQSEVFTKNDPDLSDNPSGKCKCLGGVFAWMCQPCPSTIAVYPIK
ncbi:hypothetical protein J7K42_01565 [bacterium]|nr:hypothetical protein [bacterium]